MGTITIEDMADSLSALLGKRLNVSGDTLSSASSVPRRAYPNPSTVLLWKWRRRIRSRKAPSCAYSETTTPRPMICALPICTALTAPNGAKA